MCPKKQLLGGTGVSEASEGLSAGDWSGTAGVPGASYWGRGGASVFIFPKPGVWGGVCV